MMSKNKVIKDILIMLLIVPFIGLVESCGCSSGIDPAKVSLSDGEVIDYMKKVSDGSINKGALALAGISAKAHETTKDNKFVQMGCGGDIVALDNIIGTLNLESLAKEYPSKVDKAWESQVDLIRNGLESVITTKIKPKIGGATSASGCKELLSAVKDFKDEDNNALKTELENAIQNNDIPQGLVDIAKDKIKVAVKLLRDTYKKSFIYSLSYDERDMTNILRNVSETLTALKNGFAGFDIAIQERDNARSSINKAVDSIAAIENRIARIKERTNVQAELSAKVIELEAATSDLDTTLVSKINDEAGKSEAKNKVSLAIAAAGRLKTKIDEFKDTEGLKTPSDDKEKALIDEAFTEGTALGVPGSEDVDTQGMFSGVKNIADMFSKGAKVVVLSKTDDSEYVVDAFAAALQYELLSSVNSKEMKGASAKVVYKNANNFAFDAVDTDTYVISRFSMIGNSLGDKGIAVIVSDSFPNVDVSKAVRSAIDSGASKVIVVSSTSAEEIFKNDADIMAVTKSLFVPSLNMASLLKVAENFVNTQNAMRVKNGQKTLSPFEIRDSIVKTFLAFQKEVPPTVKNIENAVSSVFAYLSSQGEAVSSRDIKDAVLNAFPPLKDNSAYRNSPMWVQTVSEVDRNLSEGVSYTDNTSTAFSENALQRDREDRKLLKDTIKANTAEQKQIAADAEVQRQADEVKRKEYEIQVKLRSVVDDLNREIFSFSNDMNNILNTLLLSKFDTSQIINLSDDIKTKTSINENCIVNISQLPKNNQFPENIRQQILDLNDSNLLDKRIFSGKLIDENNADKSYINCLTFNKNNNHKLAPSILNKIGKYATQILQNLRSNLDNCSKKIISSDFSNLNNCFSDVIKQTESFRSNGKKYDPYKSILRKTAGDAWFPIPPNNGNTGNHFFRNDNGNASLLPTGVTTFEQRLNSMNNTIKKSAQYRGINSYGRTYLEIFGPFRGVMNIPNPAFDDAVNATINDIKHSVDEALHYIQPIVDADSVNGVREGESLIVATERKIMNSYNIIVASKMVHTLKTKVNDEIVNFILNPFFKADKNILAEFSNSSNASRKNIWDGMVSLKEKLLQLLTILQSNNWYDISNGSDLPIDETNLKNLGKAFEAVKVSLEALGVSVGALDLTDLAGSLPVDINNIFVNPPVEVNNKIAALVASFNLGTNTPWVDPPIPMFDLDPLDATQYAGGLGGKEI